MASEKELIGGDFELDRQKLLGSGSWGNVYLGFQRSLGRPVAIKMLKKELVKEDEFVKNFQREASTLAKIVDERIVQVYSAGEYAGSYFFIMEYVPGVPLSKFIEHGRKFTGPETIYMATAVAKALKSAWESPDRIIHRDIKPSNIIVAYSSAIINPLIREHQPTENLAFLDLNILDSKIKIMDFGLARISRGIQTPDMAGWIIGTPKYISPEQGMGNQADIRSDIYSLGVVMYEAVAGRIPFADDSGLELINSHIHSEPPAPSLFNNRLASQLERVILKCIRKNPADRYQNPDELLDDLKSIHEPWDIQLQPKRGVPARPLGGSALDRMPESDAILELMPARKRKYRPFVFIALAIIAVAGIAIFTLNNRLKQPAAPAAAVSAELLINQARAALGLKDFSRAKELMMQASAQVHDSEELIKLIQEYNRLQSCPPQDKLAPTIRNMLKHAQLEIADNNFDKARFILSEAYFLDPCSPEIDLVFHEMEAKKKALATPAGNLGVTGKIEALIQEGLAFLQQKNITNARRKLSEARYLALQNPDTCKELGDAINNLMDSINKEHPGQ